MATAAPARGRPPVIRTKEERLALRRAYYAMTDHCPRGIISKRVDVPDNIERVGVTEPCFMCGVARGPCRHRVPA